MSEPTYGQFHVAEPFGNLASLHLHDGSALREASHEPRMGVLDQSDLIAQGIDTSKLVPGARKVNALGSCTANATTVALSSILPEPDFYHFLTGEVVGAAPPDLYTGTTRGEKGAIRFYHRCTDQTGSTSSEWPPTDCGSSGPYIVSQLESEGLISGQRIAHDGASILSLLQTGQVLMGGPFLWQWEEPAPSGMVDGDGRASTLQKQIAFGVAGGHETLIIAIVKLTLHPTGLVDPHNTILRVRNSWSRSWGDEGCYLIHLSTLVALGGQFDFRQLVA